NFNDPVRFTITTPNSPFTIVSGNVLELKTGQSLSGATSVTIQASNTIYGSQKASTTFTIGALAITAQPTNQTIAVGQIATLTVAAVALTGFSAGFQWQSAPHGSTNFTDIARATFASYTPPAFNQTGSFDYRVDVFLIDNANPSYFVAGD